MLTLLGAANQTLLAHSNPYRLYHFHSESVFLTYLPGTLLAYLPATLLRLDLRLTNLLALLLLAGFLLSSTHPGRRHQAAALIGLFLLSPYLLFRHDLYTPPHWLALAAALLLAQRGRSRVAAFVFGISVAMSQFSWILLPFFLLYVAETCGCRIALQALALALLAAALLVAPFVLADPHAFFFGVLAHWQTTGFTARPVNLSFYLATFFEQRYLQPIQLAVLTLLFFAALRTRACRSFTGSLRFMALALAAFILLNQLIWGYFFLLLELLLLIYLLSANDLLRTGLLPSLSASEEKT